MKTILVPIDFSPVTSEVLAAAAKLTRELGGRMVLLNVTKPSSVLSDHDAFMDTIAGLERNHATTSTEKSRTYEGDPERRPIPCDSIQLIGDPVTVILEQAAQLPADYIVLGSHRHSALYDCVVGSVAATVIKKAECPIMLVRPKKTKQEPFEPGVRRRPAKHQKRRQAAVHAGT